MTSRGGVEMLSEMTSKERLNRIFENKEVDRSAIKLWGYQLGMTPIHPAYKPICQIAEATTDIFSSADSKFNIYMGNYEDKYWKTAIEKTNSPLWNHLITEINFAGKKLRQVEKVSTIGEPGYILEHFVKDEKDLRFMIDLPYDEFAFSSHGYRAESERIGDRGITTFNLHHAGYAVQLLMGSELLAYMSIDERELLHEAFRLYTNRIRSHTKRAIDHGIRGVFSWVGPELLIPPLMGYRDFKDFCFDYDKQICDLIHESGGFVWVHCHGKVAKLMDDFIKMGVDVLNPLEPPKNGDVQMKEIVEKYGNQIGLEGNIEIQDILLSSKEVLHDLIHECVKEGAKTGRFILCPSAGFMEYPNPTEQYIANLEFFLEEGMRAVKKYRKY